MSFLDWKSIDPRPRSFGRVEDSEDSSIYVVHGRKDSVMALTHRSIVRYNLGLESLRKCRKWNYCARPSAHLPLLSSGVHRAEPRLHIRFRLFLAIFIHSRGQIIRGRCVELAARSFEREIAFSRGKIWRPATGKKSGLCFDVGKRRGNERTNERTKSSKHGVENGLERGGARVLKIGFVQFSNLPLLDFIIRFHVYRRIRSHRIVATWNFVCPSCNFVVSPIRSRYYYVNFLISLIPTV